MQKVSRKQRATKVAMATAFSLAIIKAAIGFSVGSLAIISSAVDSILDIVSSSVNFLAIRKSEEPADIEHPFGHGKYESLATFIQSIVIFISGILILIAAYHKFVEGSAVKVDIASLSVISISIVVTACLVIYLKSVAKRENSSIITADAMHYSIDLFTNGGILIALILIKVTGFHMIDQIIAAVVALYIIYSAIKLSLNAAGNLLDRKVEEETYKKLLDTLCKFESFNQDFHDLRTRSSGNNIFIDMHVTLCGKLTLREVHTVTDSIEKAVQDIIPDADVMIHPEPCEHKDDQVLHDDCNYFRVQEGLKKLAK